VSRGKERTLGAPDVLAILEALVRHEVDFIVIGGVAVAHHGFLRTTRNIDVVPNPSGVNLGKLWSALRELEARPAALDDMRPDQLPVPLSLESLLLHGNWDLETKHGRLDIRQYVVSALETAEDYKDLRGRAEPNRREFGTIWFIGYADLLDFKNIAGRDQDIIDIRSLEEARGSAGPKEAS
jgi:hypothetical protein